MLIDACLSWCGENEDVDAVILWPTPRSRRLYERHGFAVREDILERLIGPARPSPVKRGKFKMSHLFAYLSRMKFIRRWGLMHNRYPENIQEHSLRVAIIAHALAIIRNRMFNGSVNPERTAVLALYHDANQVLTGDLPTPVKNFNPEISAAYKEIESAAAKKLLCMSPDALKEDYRALFIPDNADRELLGNW